MSPRPSPSVPWHDDAGSGTVTALGTALLGAGLLVAVLAVGQGSVTAARAAGAADLAALAASDARRGIGPDRPCELAERTAERNGAAVTECTLRVDGSVRVVVELARTPWPASTAVAVAGPELAAGRVDG